MVTIASEAALELARQRRRAFRPNESFEPPARLGWSREIGSWPEFYAAVGATPLFARLDDFPDALLISGCDWPATTAVARLFKRAAPLTASSWGADDELDGALLLAGLRPRFALGRHCFQTTYAGERLRECFEHENFRLVWIVREPRAAVQSTLQSRGHALSPNAAPQSSRAGTLSRLERACATYSENIRQTAEIAERLGDRAAIVDYDELVDDRDRLLPALCRFAGIRCNTRLLRHLHGKSVRKSVIANWEAAIIDELTLADYWQARSVAAARFAHD